MSLQERARRKQEYLDSRQRQLNSKQSESRFQHKAQKVETDCLDCRDKSTTSRSTRSVEQTKAAKIETETSLQRAERLEVLGKTKEERLRRRQVKNEQSNSRCWATQSMKDWDGDKTTTSRATRRPKRTKPRQQLLRRGPKQTKATKSERETNLQQVRLVCSSTFDPDLTCTNDQIKFGWFYKLYCLYFY